ncbi:MAG: Crp/Fnr family transcriptional regulator [Firmicutes bacterium]|nr:Crp/Fnr family transcriptional regulator [Bacillota bacterium]
MEQKRNLNTLRISYSRIPLFNDIEESNIVGLMQCISARTKTYEKDDAIVLEGSPADFVGIVLSGKLQIIKEEFEGSLTIISDVMPGEMFGEVFACAKANEMPVSVYACEKSSVMLLNFNRLLTTCSNACPFHSKVIQNLLQIVSHKAISLNKRIEIISKRSIRDKLICYLSMEYERTRKTQFAIPFNRQQLADYLCVERSALSAEMSRMKKEKIIDYRKNEFWLL